MPPIRLIISFLAGALVAVPGMAIAQGGAPFDPPVTEPPAEVAEAPFDVVPAQEEDNEQEKIEVADVEAPEDGDAQATDGQEAGHGEAISRLAECLPSGADLHGTGLTKGHVMSQAASSGEAVVDENGQIWAVSTPEEAEELCRVVESLVEDAPDTATGRPDWAGPKDAEPKDVEVDGDGAARRGPGDHAEGNAHGQAR